MKDLLLEIGVEELPARFVAPALSALKACAQEKLKEEGLAFKSAETMGTPRRLALLIRELADEAEDRVEENLGPGMAQAKDREGNWTPAAQGFARSQGVSLDALETRTTEKGERLCAVKRFEGATASKTLPVLLPGLIKKIPFPKNMVWEESRFPFARPIRWILALHGAKPVKFSLAGVKSGKKTWALRFHHPKPLDIPSPSRYGAVLKNHCVVADPAEREEQIRKLLEQAARTGKGWVPVEKHEDLLREVVFLVEHPAAILGKFDSRYLALPPEILVTSMKKHQKFFPVFAGEKSSKLLPNFIGVRNGISENQAVVREGYERVLSARLSDAAFFFAQDQKLKISEHAEALKGVVFLAPLTYWDRIPRVRDLAKKAAEYAGSKPEEIETAGRIALLAKADLVTAVVGEFPELQGTMGRIYAAGSGEPQAVSEGIEQHYWPLTADGPLPKGTSAALVALADKIDSLAGNFLLGNIPTGSADPYGLRRAAVGALRILSDRGWHVPLTDLFEKALGHFSFPGKDPAQALQKLAGFMNQRWAALMEARGYRFDEIAAVSAKDKALDFVDFEERLKALHDIRRHPDFAPLSIAFKRADNILVQAVKKGIRPGAGVNESRLSDPAEKALHQAIQDRQEALARLGAEKKYRDLLDVLVEFRPAVDGFFNGVMVMAPEEDVRDNRLAMLARMTSMFKAVADFSVLQES